MTFDKKTTFEITVKLSKKIPFLEKSLVHIYESHIHDMFNTHLPRAFKYDRLCSFTFLLIIMINDVTTAILVKKTQTKIAVLFWASELSNRLLGLGF